MSTSRRTILKKHARKPIPNLPDKILQAGLVLRWGITREPPVSFVFLHLSMMATPSSLQRMAITLLSINDFSIKLLILDMFHSFCSHEHPVSKNVHRNHSHGFAPLCMFSKILSLNSSLIQCTHSVPNNCQTCLSSFNTSSTTRTTPKFQEIVIGLYVWDFLIFFNFSNRYNSSASHFLLFAPCTDFVQITHLHLLNRLFRLFESNKAPKNSLK